MQTFLETNAELSGLSALIECDTEKQIEAILQRVTARLGFAYYLYTGRFSRDRASSLERVLSNLPPDWLLQARRNAWPPGTADAAPGHGRLTPHVWSSGLPAPAIDKGVSFPVHHKDGAVGMLSLASDAGGDGSSGSGGGGRSYGNWLYGAIIASSVHEAMLQLVRKSEPLLEAPLTPRELECLKWVADGKSTWEISRILGISEHGVQHHVRNTMDKFNVGSRHQAVARALACGLL